MRIHNLGFPRIGHKRELKFTQEAYWRGELNQSEFLQRCQSLRQQNWQTQQQAGIEILPVGDFSHYDHVLNTSLYLGIVPKRFEHQQHNKLDLEFEIARGQSQSSCGCSSNANGSAASDMTKWFNTNYHYIVPEFAKDQAIQVDIGSLLAQIEEAKDQGFTTKPVLLGPLSYLWLGQYTQGDKLELLSTILDGYQQIFEQLNQHRVSWLQIDEPILGLELDNDWQQAFKQAYNELKKGSLKLMLTSYFASVDHHLELIASLPIQAVHLDIVSEKTDIQRIIDTLPKHWVISLGVIDGRNIWRSDLLALYQQLEPVYQQLNGRLWLAPSCSLLHSPVDLDQEEKLDSEIKNWLAFAKQKCQELALLKAALTTGELQAIIEYSTPVKQRAIAAKIHDPAVQQRVRELTEDSSHRPQNFAARKQIQQQALGLPLFPTTTIGSFPQTSEIRQLRAKWRKGEISDQQYTVAIQSQIKDTIKRQNSLDLDVLVHGEPERNDMVEYFGEQLDGFAITQFGWVQSYGSRCVKPPIIFGDISRKKPMTVDWISYAQQQTTKPVKGMLTGPVTILCWSFVRDDLALEQVAQQIALAISDEIEDLINADINIIQVDEPAIREGMPLKHSQWQGYLNWATAAFRLSCAKAPAQTQIHSHMCYSEFNDILQAIIDLDADVLTIETSRSNMAVLDAFEQQHYPNDLGPGVYDIHSPNIPAVDWMVNLLNKARETISDDRLWVNPDCGLKTRGWQETELALANMVNAAKQLRASLSPA